MSDPQPISIAARAAVLPLRHQLALQAPLEGNDRPAAAQAAHVSEFAAWPGPRVTPDTASKRGVVRRE